MWNRGRARSAKVHACGAQRNREFQEISRDFPKMQQFWENPEIAHLIFVLEMRTFNFRFEKHLIFIFTNILIFFRDDANFHQALPPDEKCFG